MKSEYEVIHALSNIDISDMTFSDPNHSKLPIFFLGISCTHAVCETDHVFDKSLRGMVKVTWSILPARRYS